MLLTRKLRELCRIPFEWVRLAFLRSPNKNAVAAVAFYRAVANIINRLLARAAATDAMCGGCFKFAGLGALR